MLTDSTPPYLKLLRYAHAFLGTGLLAFLGILLLNIYVITFFRIQGVSMESTLHNGQLVGISLLSYSVKAPALHDIVIVQYAGDNTLRFAKRVEGLPGERVVVRGQMVTLKADEYYVLGDNAEHSTDSRVFGPIKRSQIIGKVIHY